MENNKYNSNEEAEKRYNELHNKIKNGFYKGKANELFEALQEINLLNKIQDYFKKLLIDNNKSNDGK